MVSPPRVSSVLVYLRLLFYGCDKSLGHLLVPGISLNSHISFVTRKDSTVKKRFDFLNMEEETSVEVIHL